VSEHWNDSPSSVLNIYHELIAAGLRIWVFRSLSLNISTESTLTISFLQVFWRFGGKKKRFCSLVTVGTQMPLYQSHQPGTVSMH